jgi:hypothetical protein
MPRPDYVACRVSKGVPIILPLTHAGVNLARYIREMMERLLSRAAVSRREFIDTALAPEKISERLIEVFVFYCVAQHARPGTTMASLSDWRRRDAVAIVGSAALIHNGYELRGHSGPMG